MFVERVDGDLLAQDVEAIVNAWNRNFIPWSLARAQRSKMGALSLRSPESLHRQLGELAEREGIPIDQLISSAVAEKMSALMTETYLEARAKRGSRRKLEAVLARIPDVDPRTPITCRRGRKARRPKV